VYKRAHEYMYAWLDVVIHNIGWIKRKSAASFNVEASPTSGILCPHGNLLPKVMHWAAFASGRLCLVWRYLSQHELVASIANVPLNLRLFVPESSWFCCFEQFVIRESAPVPMKRGKPAGVWPRFSACLDPAGHGAIVSTTTQAPAVVIPGRLWRALKQLWLGAAARHNTQHHTTLTLAPGAADPDPGASIAAVAGGPEKGD
jgi:hypothetical protein